jgi:hypothetical protein
MFFLIIFYVSFFCRIREDCRTGSPRRRGREREAWSERGEGGGGANNAYICK